MSTTGLWHPEHHSKTKHLQGPFCGPFFLYCFFVSRIARSLAGKEQLVGCAANSGQQQRGQRDVLARGSPP